MCEHEAIPVVSWICLGLIISLGVAAAWTAWYGLRPKGTWCDRSAMTKEEREAHDRFMKKVEAEDPPSIQCFDFGRKYYYR